MLFTKTYPLNPNNPAVILKSYLLTDSPELLNGASRPAVLICPGGAYLSLSDREAEPVALKFNSLGYHAFVLNYSVYNNPDENFFQMDGFTVRETSLYPAALLDIGRAIIKINQLKDQYLIDVDQLVVCGFSAGAHNTAMYATHWHRSLITELAGANEAQMRPAGIILAYTLSDYKFLAEHIPVNEMDQKLWKASNTSVFGETSISEEMQEKFSPVNYVDEQTPPTFLWCTSEDRLVPPYHSLALAMKLSEKHVPFELHVFEEGAHGLALATAASSSAKTQVLPRVATWTDLAASWLDKRLNLPLQEKTPFE